MAASTTPNLVPAQLFDPRRGDLAFKLTHGGLGEEFSRPRRSNYFNAILARTGAGRFHADLAVIPFRAPVLLFSNPYQLRWLEEETVCAGSILQFHANFFCIETYHEAVGCNGVLFNNIYGEPIVHLDDATASEFEQLIEQMDRECAAGGVAREEILVSYLKVFLIKATRLKLEQQAEQTAAPGKRVPDVLKRLTDLIEANYRTKRTPAAYAEMLHMSAKALGKVVKAHCGRTLTDLIRERVLKHAKWQLLHTLRPVKEVAWELGFSDEFYFSRVFKQATGLSPKEFREFETEIRGGRNLSM